MILTFKEDGHLYESNPPINWTSVTKLVEHYCQPFSEEQAELSSKNPRSKWYGLDVDLIKGLWRKENQRSTDLGHWFHTRMEQRALSCGSKLYKGKELPIIGSRFENGLKIAPDGIIKDGIYVEHFVYSEEYRICGQVDVAYGVNKVIDVDDYKSVKELKFEGYKGAMMIGPLSHLPDSNFYHYALQLNIYAKLILLKNPEFSIGELKIIHITFEEAGKDKYGFPIYKQLPNGEFVVKGHKYYKLPDLQKEVDIILENHKNNYLVV